MEMKKNPFSYSRMIAAILIITTIAVAAFWFTPSFAQPAKNKHTAEKPLSPQQYYANEQERKHLVQLLLADNIINETDGYIIIKRHNSLHINWRELPDNLANKYLSDIKQEELLIEFYPYPVWLRYHYKADVAHYIKELIFPIHWREFGSPALCAAKLVSAHIRRFATGIHGTIASLPTTAS